jgi:hypothetical protein
MKRDLLPLPWPWNWSGLSPIGGDLSEEFFAFFTALIENVIFVRVY